MQKYNRTGIGLLLFYGFTMLSGSTTSIQEHQLRKKNINHPPKNFFCKKLRLRKELPFEIQKKIAKKRKKRIRNKNQSRRKLFKNR